jgi:hypothetical protein
MRIMAYNRKDRHEDNIGNGMSMTEANTGNRDSLVAKPRDKKINIKQKDLKDSRAILEEDRKVSVKGKGLRDSPDKTMEDLIRLKLTKK